MNFLAHLYLSGGDSQIKLGNFISDWIKGKDYLKYPLNIQKGIILHRHIDSFTDSHPVFIHSCTYFRPAYRKFAGIIVDIMYDHFLASKWQNYHSELLTDFARNVYALLISNLLVLPIRVRIFIPKMIFSRRLESYAHLAGIENVLEIMTSRMRLPDQTKEAMLILRNNYEELSQDFDLFFEDICQYVEQTFQIKLELPL
jgi:acyl carrier protein phosphodiesterase